MRRKEQEVTDKSIIQKILTGSDICRIAINGEVYPYIVPMNFGYSDNALYFHSAAAGEKMDLIRKNNKVCFEIEYAGDVIRNEDPCKWATRYLSVIGCGEIEIITDTNDKKRGLDIIMNHYGKTTGNEYNNSQVNNLLILKLTINDLTAKRSGNWVDL